ncbi:MAG TPA: hypothetical protein VJL59_21120 [Anaerolineales bacterium]|nr:hypothetical protein [Anaerolineales bacterium]
MEVKVLFRASKRIHPKFGNVVFGKYTIEPLPTEDSFSTSATNKYLLRFDDEIRAEERRSNPEKEARLILSYLSLALGTKLDFDSLMINSVNTPLGATHTNRNGELLEELPPLDILYNKLQGADIDAARQFLRACEVYRTAVNALGQNNTLSYFLLTVAIECLSNVLGQGDGKCDKFIDFILKHLPDRSELSEEDWRELLKEVYYHHRSGFTHGGKELPEASDLADRLNRIYVRNFIDGKEIRTPGLKWFASVVRQALLGYLMTIANDPDRAIDVVKDLSLEHGAVQLKAKRDIQAFSIVTEQDFELD